MAVAIAIGVLPACSCDEESKSTAVSSAVAVDLSPVPAPAGLIADVYVSDPATSWAALRKLSAGTPAALLPGSFALLAGTFFGLAPDAAAGIDASLPAYAAVAEGKEGEFHAAVAVHVRSGRELLALLTRGTKPPFKPGKTVAGLTPLTRVGGADQAVVLAISGNYLIAAPSVGALTALGPYTSRTLPKNPKQNAPVVAIARSEALKGPLARRLRGTWNDQKKKLEALDAKNRKDHGGRAPDFGDPAAALLGVQSAVDGLVGVLETSSQLRVAVTPRAKRLDVHMTLTPNAKGAAKEAIDTLDVGPMQPVLDLPADVALAAIARSGSKNRQASAESFGKALIKVFGDRLKAPEQSKLTELLTKLAGSRGEVTLYGAGFAKDGVFGLMRADVSDPKAFDASAKQVFDLLKMPAFREPVRQFLGDPTVKHERAKVDGVATPVHKALVTLKPTKSTAIIGKSQAGPMSVKVSQGKPIEFLWTTAEGTSYAAAGGAAPARLAALKSASGATLGANAAMKAAAERAGKYVNFGLILQPAQLGMGRTAGADPTAPLVMSVGREKKTGELRLELADSALKALIGMVAKR